MKNCFKILASVLANAGLKVTVFSVPQWFGFLKMGQAKETETLQESVLYKEVDLGSVLMKFQLCPWF